MELGRRVRVLAPEEEWVAGAVGEVEEAAEVVWAVVVLDRVESVFAPPVEQRLPIKWVPPATR
jgi:hypothetical protein